MKILHINSYYAAGIFYKNLYDQQIENGLDVDVYVPVAKSVNLSSLDLGLYTDIRVNHSKYDRVLFHLKHFKIYKDILKQYKFDDYSLIHAHSLFSNGYIALKLKQRFQTEYIVAVRNTDVNTFFKYMIHLKRLGIQILYNASKVVFLSKPYRDNVIEKYVPPRFQNDIYNKGIIIPNGIDDYWFSNIGETKKRPKGKKVKLLYVGVINRNKNIATTIKAIDILKKKGYEITLTAVGEIMDLALFNRIKDNPHLKYLTPRPKEDLLKIYRDNDIFIMPSIHESFGLVYAEAISQGTPVIYSKGQGFDAHFEDGLVGYRVNCFDENEITDKVIRILGNYEDHSDACIRLCDRFNWASISQQYRKIYSEIQLS